MSKLTKLNRCGYADQYQALRAPTCGCEFCGMKWQIKQLQAEIDELKQLQAAPKAAIDSILTEVMDNAVANGANSISMPDEYVEVAAWLCGIPPVKPLNAEQPGEKFREARLLVGASRGLKVSTEPKNVDYTDE